MEISLEDLNAEQRRAVLFGGRSLLVAAGPGSGKTRVLTRRIAHRIVERKLEPRRVLAVTFTNRAAREMSGRVQELMSTEVGIPVGTFHWMCAGILRRRIDVLGYRPDFRLLQPWEARKVLQATLSGPAEPSFQDVSSLANALSGLKSGIGIDSLAAGSGIPPARLRQLADEYQRALRQRNALDLDDLPYLAAQLLRDHPAVRAACRAAIDELLVDEYQDTNVVQQELVKLLAPVQGTVMVVGDEDQAIYGWRHADPDGFRRFQAAFPAAELITLERSYRHHKFVARAANSLISHARVRVQKAIVTELPAGNRPICYLAADERDEADWIAGTIVDFVSSQRVAAHEIAVLYRINAQSRALEDGLMRRGVPYRVLSGRGFYVRTHIQRVFAYLRLALDGRDDAAVELLLQAIPGLGPARLAEVLTVAGELSVSLLDALPAVQDTHRLPRNLRAAVQALHDRIAGVAAVRKQSVVTVCDAALQAAQYDLEQEGMLTEPVIDDFAELRALVRAHHARRGTLRSLVDTLTFDDPGREAVSGVNLMSLHSSKGLEYGVVFVAGVEEGLLPHMRSLARPEAIEEERRLCYVGMTRARDNLHLSYAQSRLVGGQGTTGQPSRFIGEIGLHNVILNVTTATQVKPRLATTRAGDRVRHTRWGTGTVEKVEGTGPDTLTTILFDAGGRRRLQLSHAPLTLEPESPSDVSSG